MDHQYSSNTGRTASRTPEKAPEAMDNLSKSAADLKAGVTAAATEQFTKAKAAAEELKDQATEKLQSTISDQKNVGAELLHAIADSMNGAAREFDSSIPQIAGYIRRTAEQVDGLSSTVRDKDLRELYAQAEGFARKQPALVFGGAVILGFAALRFLKSTRGQTASTNDRPTSHTTSGAA